MLILSSFWPLKLVDRKGSGSQKLYTKKCKWCTRKFVWYRDSEHPGTLGMGPRLMAPRLLYSYIILDCWFIFLKRNKSLEKCLSFKAILHMHSLLFLGSNSSLISLSEQFNSISTCFCIRSVGQSCPTLCDAMNRSTPGLPVHHQLPEFTQTRPSSQWCHPAISSSVIPFSSCPQSLPASESFPRSQHFTWGGQSTGVSALASFLPQKSQGWSPSEWTGWISLQSKGLSRVFSNTIVQKHQFFGAQPFPQSNSHIHTWPQEKP